MTEILLVWGTRPEAIKLGPVAYWLKRLGVNYTSLCTGQHTDLLEGTPVRTDLKDSESLGMASDGRIPAWKTRVQNILLKRMKELDPKIVVVQGDTMSAESGAIVSNLLEIPLAHIEAGVRSHDLNEPWPEEMTRVGITKMAKWHYAPTPTAFVNLLTEGISEESIRMTGNTVVSALRRYAPDVEPTLSPDPTIFVTLHRREVQTRDTANKLYGAMVVAALKFSRIAFVWPMHPGFRKLLNRVKEPNNLEITKPIPYWIFVERFARALGILTDSGGLVEEAATLGVPTAVLRKVNDRPEAEEVGIARRFDPTAAGVFDAVELLATKQIDRKAHDIYGSGDPAKRVAQHLAEMADNIVLAEITAEMEE